MQFNEGDIIYTSCGIIPLCYHVGIVLIENGQPVVYNHTPKRQNEYGGNIIAQPYNDFISTRVFYKTEPSTVSPDHVRQYSYANRHRAWSAASYNCEDYVREIVEGHPYSILRRAWMTVFFVAIVSTFIYIKTP